LASSQPQVRQQLIPALQKILHSDFPEKWPSFLDITVQLLNTNDASSIFTGLQCLLAICRVYRFKSGENRAGFNKIVEATFPRLLVIGTSLMNETSDEAAEMLHVALKAFKHATFVRPWIRRQPLVVLTGIVRFISKLKRTTKHYWVVLLVPPDHRQRSSSKCYARGYLGP
jgi:importin-7